MCKKIVAHLLVLTLPMVLSAEDLPHSLSMQGYTGLINTPNAQVMNEGDIAFSFNNQFDNHLRGYDENRERTDAEDYVFGVGLFPNFELQGRLKEQPGYGRDLSGNMKFKIPKIYEYFPDVAFGIQDIGGETSHYTNYYLVADKSIGVLRASLGYGYSRTSVSYRMDGLFGGVEAQIFPWLTLLGEYDGEESHAGMRMSIPHDWSDKVRLNTTIASNISDDYETSFMISALFPLYETKKFSVPEDADKHSLSAGDIKFTSTSLDKESSKKTVFKEPSHLSELEDVLISPENLAKNLVEEGLENVTVATKEDILYISYENNVYLWNEIDALGVVLRKAVKMASTYKSFIIEPKKSNVLISSFKGSLEKAAAYFEKPSYSTQSSFLASLSQQQPSEGKGFDVHTEDLNSGLLRTRIVLSPKVTTFVGTEVGLFDYQFLLRTVGYWNLYKGLDLSVRYDIPISYSDELDPDTGVFRNYYNDGGLNAVMLNYTVNINGGLNTLSVGSYEYDYVGAMDQFIYNYNRHTFKVKLGYFTDNDNEFEDKKIYLVKYTYSYEPLDLFGEIQAGKYWYQDTGFSVNIKRFFGDVAISLEYLQTQPDGYLGQAEATNKYAGLSVEIPLDFRKNRFSGNIGQIRGDNLNYGMRSTIDRADGTNAIVPSSGLVPVTDFESEDYLLNRNRMNLGYITEHIDRLLDVF